MRLTKRQKEAPLLLLDDEHMLAVSAANDAVFSLNTGRVLIYSRTFRSLMTKDLAVGKWVEWLGAYEPILTGSGTIEALSLRKRNSP